MQVERRFHNETDGYRYGFQGQERDDELKGEGNSLNYTFRMHDPRVGRFFSVDPLAPDYPYNSPYAFSENRVMDGVELEGLEFQNLKSKFKSPEKLKPQLPDYNKDDIQIQVYKSTVTKTKVSFDKLRDVLLTKPQKILNSSGADFNPDFPKGKMEVGNNIKIDIFGLLNNSYVRVSTIENIDNFVRVTFVTLEGHVEKGEIQFSIQKLKNDNLIFTINGKSMTNYGLAPDSFMRSKQTEAWYETIANFINVSGGEEVSRTATITDQTMNETTNEVNKTTVNMKVAKGNTDFSKQAELTVEALEKKKKQ